jgi:hypothetical protein
MPNYRLEKDSLQWGFNQSRAKLQIMGGGYGNGKTTAAVVKALQLAKDYPGSNGLIARATYPKLNDTIRKEFMAWCPKNWVKRRPTQDDNTCYLTNGSVVNFRYVSQKGKAREDGSSTSNLLSASYDWIVVDQIEDPEITHKDLLDLMGRLRGATPYRPTDVEDKTMPSTGPRWLLLTANPSPNWFYKEIIKPYVTYKKTGVKLEKLLLDEETGLPMMDLFEGSTYTNKANLSPDYIKGLESMYKGQMRVRFLEGKWAAFEGLVHEGYNADENGITRHQALLHLEDCLRRHVKVKVVEAYDFGLVSPSCYMFGFVDDWGRVIILDGYYKPNFPYTEQPDAIRAIRAEYAAYDIRFGEPVEADPAIFKKIVIAGLKNTGESIGKIYRSEYNLHMRPASNDIISGIAKVNGYINGLKHVPHLITKELGSTLLYVCNELTWFDDEISNYYWKKNPTGEAIDEPQDHGDHAMNCVKYMVSHLPVPSKIEPPAHALPKPWLFWREEEDKVA